MKKRTPIWMLASVVKAVHQELIATHGGLPGIRDEALLESALARPLNLFAYTPAVSMAELAACYSVGLAKNHPFMDGNKRIALTIGATLLQLNGYTLNAPETDAVLVFNQVAAGSMNEQTLSAWFDQHSK
jgi:death on curing protein